MAHKCTQSLAKGIVQDIRNHIIKVLSDTPYSSAGCVSPIHTALALEGLVIAAQHTVNLGLQEGRRSASREGGAGAGKEAQGQGRRRRGREGAGVWR